MKTRREFLGQVACGSCMLMGGSTLLLLNSCTTVKIYKTVSNDSFSIPLSAFENKSYIAVKHEQKGNILVRKKEMVNLFLFP